MAQINNITQNEEKVSVGLLTPWIKGTLAVDDNFLRMDVPNTIILGLIGAGMRKNKTPIDSISNIYTNTEYKIWKMLLGAIIAIFGFTNISSSFLTGVLLMVLGIFIIGTGIQTVFSYENMGNTKSIPFPFYEADRVQRFESHVSEIVEKHYIDKNK